MEPKKKVIKERQCIACKQRLFKGNLIRIVKNKDNEIFIDKSGKADGRGAYVCNSIDCIKTVSKKRLLNRAFKCAISDELYLTLVEQFEKENGLE